MGVCLFFSWELHIIYIFYFHILLYLIHLRYSVVKSLLNHCYQVRHSMDDTSRPLNPEDCLKPFTLRKRFEKWVTNSGLRIVSQTPLNLNSMGIFILFYSLNLWVFLENDCLFWDSPLLSCIAWHMTCFWIWCLFLTTYFFNRTLF